VLGAAERNFETSCEGKARANKLTFSAEVALLQPERPRVVAPSPIKSERRFINSLKTLDGQAHKTPSYEDTAPVFSYSDLPLNEPRVGS
jgi:hypothetical protein